MESAVVFWFDGIFLCAVSLLGMILNTLSISILWTKAKVNSMFNKLLVSLLFIDSFLLLTSILWNLKWNLGFRIHALTMVYPYFVLPFNHIAMTTSIFMTIGITHDRYLATRKHISHNQSLSPPSGQLRRMIAYLLPILTLSIIFNIPKFLELKIVYAPLQMHEYIQKRKSEAALATNFIEDLQYSSEVLPNWKNEDSIPEIYISDFLISNQNFLTIIGFLW